MRRKGWGTIIILNGEKDKLETTILGKGQYKILF